MTGAVAGVVVVADGRLEVVVADRGVDLLLHPPATATSVKIAATPAGPRETGGRRSIAH